MAKFPAAILMAVVEWNIRENYVKQKSNKEICAFTSMYMYVCMYVRC